jgi:hypothetical protein
MKSWPSYRDRKLIYDALPDRAVAAVWENTFETAWAGRSETWDFQWVYAMLSQNGLAISPARNLITNVGFDERATHTTDPLNDYSSLRMHAMDLPLKHNPYFVPATGHEMKAWRRMFLPSLAVRI